MNFANCVSCITSAAGRAGEEMHCSLSQVQRNCPNLDTLDAGRSPNAVRVHFGTTQAHSEVDRPPPADSPPGDVSITMVKETVILYKGISKNEKRWHLFVSLNDVKGMKTRNDCEIACDCVKRANVCKLALVGIIPSQLFSFSYDKDRRTDSRIRLKAGPPPPPWGYFSPLMPRLLVHTNFWRWSPTEKTISPQPYVRSPR